MEFSDDLVARAKAEFKDKDGKEMSDGEAQEALQNLAGLFELLYEGAVEDQRRKQRLKKEPEGFSLDGHYTCHVCHNTFGPDQNWYSRWGITCRICLRALKDGTVPDFVTRDRESFYADWQLKSDFNIHPQTMRKMVRLGELKARIVLNENGRPYEYIFLKKENPQLIDPKRHSPARKSYERNREKLSDARIREAKKEFREERKKELAKWKKIRHA